MASFFGEVVFPTCRAIWDEDDEDGATGNADKLPELSVRWLKERPTHIKTLVVIEGDMLIDFTRQSLCRAAEEVCQIEDAMEKRVSSIHRLNQEVYLCIVSSPFDMRFAGTLVEKIADVLSCAECTVSITCRHVSHFKSTNVPNTPSFLRMLSTKSGEDYCKQKEDLLEQPNIVAGVTAGILSYAEFMAWPSILYILYTDTFVLDSVSAEPLLNLLKALNCAPKNVTFSEDRFCNKGNLYM